MTLRRKLTLGAVVLFLSPALLLIEEHFRGKWALARWQARMIAKGEKFQVEQLVPAPLEVRDNGLAALVWAAGQLQANSGLREILPPSFHFAAPGKVVYIVGQSNWHSSSSSKGMESNVTWHVLSQELAKISQPFDDIRAALKKPAFDAHLDFHAGFNLLLPHLARTRSAASPLSGAIVNELHNGDLEKALENLEALLALSRQKDEFIVISQLVRIAIAQIAAGVTWQALQTPGWTDAQLSRMQAGWEQMEFIGTMGRSLEMERAMVMISYDSARRSAKETAALMDGLAGGGGAQADTGGPVGELLEQLGIHFSDLLGKTVRLPLWRFVWSYQDELHYFQVQQRAIEIARQAAAQKSGTSALAWPATLESEYKLLGPYRRMRLSLSISATSSLARCPDKAVRCETVRQLVLAAIALKRYELRFQKPAPNLSALAPDFLPQPPVDYMNGHPLRYQLNPSGGFRLYSVGEDQQDDGGDSEAASLSSMNWLNARDIVWPAPASAEEIAAESGKKRTH